MKLNRSVELTLTDDEIDYLRHAVGVWLRQQATKDSRYDFLDGLHKQLTDKEYR